MTTDFSKFPVRKKKYDCPIALVRFTCGAGCCKDYKTVNGTRRHSSGGCETPENFFEPSKWWAHDYLEIHDKKCFEGVPYMDCRHMDGTAALIEMSFNGPILDASLPPGTVSRLLRGKETPLAPLALEGDFAALMDLQLAHDGEAPGPMDSVSLDIYLALWKRAGAIVGTIRKGQFVPL